MGRRFYHAKDGNHAAIREAVEARGYLWVECSQTGLGIDALVAVQGRLVPIEVKDGRLPPSRRKLTEHEREVHQLLGAHGIRVELITSIEDLDILGRCQRNSYEER